MNMNKTLAVCALSASLLGGCCTACFKGTCNAKSKPAPAATTQPVATEPEPVATEPTASEEPAVAVHAKGWGVWIVAGGLILGGAALHFLTHRKK